MEFLTSQALRSRRGCSWIGLGPLQSEVHHPFPSVLPLMTGCRLLHQRALSLSPGMTTRLRCPLQVVRARWLSFPRPLRISGSCGILHCIRFFEAGRVVSRWKSCWFSEPPSGAILPEVHEELTRLWKAPFTARNKSGSSSPSPPSMVEPLWGTRASPLWSSLWPCNCDQQPLPLCGVIRVSPRGPVCTRKV